MTSLHVICGLGSTPIKNPGYAYAVYTVRTKLQNFLRSYMEGVYTIQNGAYERNGLTAYFVSGNNIMLNWMTEITDLLQFYVVLVKFGPDYAS